MEDNNSTVIVRESPKIQVDPTTRRWRRELHHEIRKICRTNPSSAINLNVENAIPVQIQDIVYQFFFRVFFEDGGVIDYKQIKFTISGKDYSYDEAFRSFLDVQNFSLEDQLRFPLLYLVLQHANIATEPFVAYVNSWFGGDTKVDTVFKCNEFDYEKEPDFVVFSLEKINVIIYSHTRVKYELTNINKALLPDGLTDKKFIVKKIKTEERYQYPYPPCITTHRPFIIDNTFYVAVNTASAANGVFLLEIDADTDWAKLPNIVLNGANKHGKLISKEFIAPFDFSIKPRIEAFDKLDDFLDLLPFEKEISISLLFCCFIGTFGLSKSNNIIIIRLLGEGAKFKTSIAYSIKWLLQGIKPKSEEKLDAKTINKNVLPYFDERMGSQQKEDQAEKISYNIIADNSPGCIMQSSRMLVNDANMGTKTIDFDCRDTSRFHDDAYSDEQTEQKIKSLRPAILSFLVSLVPEFLDDKDPENPYSAFQPSLVWMRQEFKKDVKIRLAESLAPLFLLLRQIEDLMISKWGADYTAEGVFCAFMKYEEQIGQILERAKDPLVTKIEELGRKCIATGSNPFQNGIHFVKAKNQMSGSWEEWDKELRSKFDVNKCPFSNQEDLKTLFREAGKHLEKTGWIFDWSYKNNNRSGVRVTLPVDFQKDMLPDTTEVKEAEYVAQ